MKLIKEIKLIFIYIQFLNENYEIVDIIGAKANENNKYFLQKKIMVIIQNY